MSVLLLRSHILAADGIGGGSSFTHFAMRHTGMFGLSQALLSYFIQHTIPSVHVPLVTSPIEKVTR